MTDRQPGAPGQYIMTVDPSVAQNLLIGEPVAVKLTRDDQPIVEGTPYNKASVLPDDLARQLCPKKNDPTPADAFNGLRKKKFPATLYSGAWGESGGQFTQTILISEVTGDEYESVRSWPVYTGNKEEDEKILEACAAVTYANRNNGSVTYVCLNDRPETDISVIVEVSR
jgi:hypothetical protein